MFATGTAMALKELERVRAFEAKRKKWINAQVEDGKLVEYLMVNCEHCGQLWPRQRVVRCNEQELNEWDMIEKEQTPSSAWIVLCVVAPLACFATGIIAWLASHSFYVGAGVFVATVAAYMFFMFQHDKQRKAEAEKKKQILLSAHGDIPQDEVGTPAQYYKKFVLVSSDARSYLSMV